MDSPDKVKAIIEYPVHKTVRDVRAFIGLASFYGSLVPKISKPLTGLIREWGEPQ
jgi:hypothetical protein